MDFYSDIEKACSIKIKAATFTDEKFMHAALGTTPNNVEEVFWGEAKNCVSVNGAVYEGTTLLYVPAGLSGEYTVIPGTTKISAGALAGTKLTKLIIPSTITDYKSVTDGIAGLEVEVYPSEPADTTEPEDNPR